jgi:hypothetical protein
MVLQVAGFTNSEADTSPDAAKAALNYIKERISSLEAEVQYLRLKMIFSLLFLICSFQAKSNTESFSRNKVLPLFLVLVDTNGSEDSVKYDSSELLFDIQTLSPIVISYVCWFLASFFCRY